MAGTGDPDRQSPSDELQQVMYSSAPFRVLKKPFRYLPIERLQISLFVATFEHVLEATSRLRCLMARASDRQPHFSFDPINNLGQGMTR
jgi:hypothetical protein